MTDAKKKEKPTVKTRPPGKLPSAFDRPARVPDGSQVAEILGLTPPPTAPSDLLPPPTTSYQATAPERDFTRVFNSVTRDAIPAGLFKGNSKKVYDVLYLRTRGAIVPVRRTKIKQSELRELAKVSHNTLREHLRHLETVGLVIRRMEMGDNEGAVYEVFVPEELPPPTTPYHHVEPPPTTTQFLGSPSSQNLVGGGGGQVFDSQRPNEPDKTSFKTNTEKLDDEASRLASALSQAERELTGKNAAKGEQWDELASVLITELRIAAGRTTVSSVPAFLAEHLRRRLFKKDKRQLEAESLVEADSEQKKGITGDISKCPDCFGTSMYYPEGFDKGVARCEHPSLRDS